MSYSDLQYRDAEMPDDERDEWSDELSHQAQQQQDEEQENNDGLE